MFSNVAAKVPWGSSSSKDSQHHEEEGESLTTVLKTEADRAALTILVADCAAVMRQGIVDVFDASQTGTTGDMVADLAKGVEGLEVADNQDQVESVEAEERKESELKKREEELSAPKFMELRNAALKHFDEWRDSVILRIGEVVNSRREAEKQMEQADHKKVEQRDPVEQAKQYASTPQKFPDQPKFDEAVDAKTLELYPPVETDLTLLKQEQRALILHSLLLLLLSLENYQSYSRTLLVSVSTSLGLPLSHLASDENKVARVLLSAAETMAADEETKKRAEENQTSRKWKVGLATVAGAALIGVTGGLAAPLLAAGVGTVMGGLGLGATAAAGYLGTMAGSAVLVGGLFGAYGGRMTGQMMDQYAREVEDFGFVPIRHDSKPRKIEKEYRRLRVGIGISGWLTEAGDVAGPWNVIGNGLETFALRWELEALLNLGNSLTTMVKSYVWGFAKKEIISRTLFGALLAGLWPLGLLKVSRIVDNPWSVAFFRAQKAGEVLADALVNKAQGERPVTLVGYGLGAKVIFTCLKHLADRKAFGLVESVVLIGAPTPSTAADWRVVRSVVSGRVVNVYSTNDYILAFLYRSSSIQLGIAGLQPVQNVKGVENVDVSEMINGHLSYRLLVGSILKQIGFENVDYVEQEKKQQLSKEQEEQEKQAQAAEATEQGDVSDQQVEDMEKEIDQKNKQTYMAWAQEKMNSAGSSTASAYEKAKARLNFGQKTADDRSTQPQQYSGT